MDMGKRIKQQRINAGYTQEELAEKLGLKKSAIAKYENGRVENIKRSTIQTMAQILGCSPSYLMGWDDLPSNVKPVDPSSRTVKIYGRIAGGKPIEMIENVIDEVDLSTLPEKYDGHYFGLQIRGHSMEPDIKDGDYIICVEAEDAESGDIVAVTVNGEDATCKRILKYKDGIRLVPLNPSYEVKYYTNKEVLSLPVRVIGRVLEARHRFHD